MDPLVQLLVAEIRRRNGAEVPLDDKALARIEDAAGRARDAIGRGAAQSQVLLPFLTALPNGPVHFDVIITKADLERIDGSGTPEPPLP